MKRSILKMTAVFLSVILCLAALMPVPAAQADEDISNMFVGTINGEEVVAFLDYTYRFSYGDGGAIDMDASFVSFDEEGNLKYEIGVRVTSKTEEQTYGGIKEDAHVDFISARMVYLEESFEFKDYYRIVEEDTDWEVTFYEMDWDSGVVRGRAEAVLLPSRYNHSPYPTRDQVIIEGEFEFRAKSIHPVMEEYRLMHQDYAEANEVEFFQALGGMTYSSDNDSDSGKGSGSSYGSARICVACRGSRKCHACGGQGYTIPINLGGGVKRHKCSICGGKGVCTHC